ncbi:MAG: lysine transporter LysE [Chloroflexi bacterium GWB2_49_20]|nr:MAG: lysine transporter LysE [Chloroflexi bacterium GWB2_49_20]OGN79990.1 MAG: lysine transporter LysE [Chloroflexi bacterium GWC2_49_37]OGN85474.1 MAG: lysine transporter LysE [Chloroflexi bacterium GWD2_49_16]HBG74341.1 lysine transporter LysE [Anaerolineae bacterium]HCM97049.1 lysine transporter LysE [Anaerolineae bacterium]
MELSLLVKGLVLGFSIAAPVGPIGILCIRRTLSDGRLAGLLSGLGAASADALYGSVAGFGITIISNFLISQQNLLRLIGGFFLCYLGIRTIRAIPAALIDNLPKKDLSSIYLTTFFLTLTNPMTIISFAAIFSGLGLVNANMNYLSAFLLIIGVFFGSALWWILLSLFLSTFRLKFNLYLMKWVNRLSGLIILGFGVFALVSLI